MDKSCPPPAPPVGDSSAATATATTSNSNNNSSTSGGGGNSHYLNQLHKFSHKISKPPLRKPPASFDLPHPLPLSHHQSLILDESQSQTSNLHHQQQQQPPVYNINKNDFRDVVQKLTGSPAHERLSAPPPIQPPKPPSSRLQRIRPPPLEHLTARPPPLINEVLLSQNPTSTAAAPPAAPVTNFFQRQVQPLSPLPPLPAVHAAAESPISAYMRYLQTSSSGVDSDPKRLSGLSPRWNSLSQPLPALPLQASSSAPPLHFPTTAVPLPLGCLPSPRSPYPLLSPGSLFSPTNQFGFQQFPLSPTLPVPSPRWKSH